MITLMNHFKEHENNWDMCETLKPISYKDEEVVVNNSKDCKVIPYNIG